jgi:parallel beta-helix repeat protein
LQTNGDGNYNYTFLSPSISANYPIKVNTTYEGLYVENETTLGVKTRAIYNTFNGATTDFNSVPDITNVCQPILEKTGSGKIQWNNCVNAEAANFDSYVTLSSNLARVLSSGLHSSFNSSANVTLYGLTFKNPGILWDPEDDGTFTKCPDNICTKLSYASGNLLFNVTQFTGYSGGEAPNVTLISPADNTLTVNTTLTFVANITAATNLTNVSLWHNISGSWALNDTWYYGNLAPESSTVGLWHFDEGDGKTAADSALTNNGTHYGNTVMLLHLDENTSTTAYDASPYGNNGTLTNSPTWATGKSGSALNFKGSNDYVDLANNINFSGNTWTFAFWFNFGGANAAAIGDQGMIGKAGNTNTANDWWIERVRSGSTNNILRFQQISVNAWDASAVFTDNSGWHHAALVLNATNMTWYIDGVVNATFGAPPTLINSENLVLGYFWTTPGWRSYNGSIDEAAIYSRALSASEILVNYNAGKAKFTDWTNASKLGSYAMEFDGVNDYVKVSSLNPPIGGSTANLSVELWFSTKDVTTSCTTLFTRASDTLGWNEYCLICEDSKIQCSGYSTTEHMPDIKTSSTLEANKWYHFVYERDDTTKTRKLYLNGVRDDDGAGAYGGDQTAADDLYIGQNYNNEYYFNGTIDEVIIYNRSLSAAEIKALYQHKNYATSDSVNWAIDNIPVGTYNWNVQAFDSQGLDDWGDSNYSFRIYNTSLTDCRTIDASDTYILVNNVSSSGTCFTIAANDVTLDCQGYMINGTDAALSNGIDNTGGFDNITIKNCVIKDFDRGIYFINAENGTLANNSAYSNNRGIAFESSSNNILANNNVSSNANFGILLDSSSNGNTVTSNTANSIEWGIYISASSNGNTITNNNANSNTYDGIYLFSSSSNNLTNNTANSNSQYGIALESSSNNILQDNTANGPNQVRGIDINGGSGNNLTNNNATDNTLWDFYSKNNAAGNIVLNLSTQQNLVSFTSKDIALKGLSKFATPAFRSNATSTSGTANKPSGVVENDVLIAHIYTLGSSTYPTITPPSGWTSIRNMTYQQL